MIIVCRYKTSSLQYKPWNKQAHYKVKYSFSTAVQENLFK